ncbi:hypothetical protein PTT_10476 [Pyrenophora teres f. teres 0-1]|uniref:Uncharacterized protein n=1 Tax=Pyrenophora teres f. teres (strain 0-1) TaxID=861557 RepID=E3RPC2_PYRTT|nr:hypothetical protein PTT_10476 [Pyrenophora teres f. teres 0-1]
MVSLDLHSSAALIYGLSSLVAVETGLSLVTGYTIANLTLKPEDVSLGLVLQNVSHIVIKELRAALPYHNFTEK